MIPYRFKLKNAIVKPVFQPETISNLKGMIDAVMQPESGKANVSEVIDDIQKSLQEYQDNKENKIFLLGSAGLVVLFALILMFTTKAS